MQQPNAAIGGLDALGRPHHRASVDALNVPRPMVVFSTASGEGASVPYNPAPYGDDIRARAVRELMAEGGAVSKEDLAEKEKEIHDRLYGTNTNGEFTAHASEAAVTSFPVSVPRAIADALRSGIAGAQRAAREVGFAPRTAWAV